MKILIVSDSHGHNEIIDDLILRYKDVDLYLHAGDSVVPPHTLYPFRAVKGNCDYYYDYKQDLLITTPFGNLYMSHLNDKRASFLNEKEVVFYVYGHTHVKKCVKKNGICYINPGSLTYPRDNECSYAMLDINEEGGFCTFYDALTHAPLKTFHIYKGVPKETPDMSEEDKGPSLEEIKTSLKNSEEIKTVIKEEIKKSVEGE